MQLSDRLEVDDFPDPLAISSKIFQKPRCRRQLFDRVSCEDGDGFGHALKE